MIDFKSNTTWRGIIAVTGAIAIVIRPDQIAIIIPAYLTLIGAINIAREK